MPNMPAAQTIPQPRLPLRSPIQKAIDTVAFPLRALTLFHKSGMGLTSLADERFDYVAREARGHTLDIGCGRENRFVQHFLRGRGKGIDLFPYEGLSEDHLVPDLTRLPFADASFDTVTFIANINHCPEPSRDAELAEAFRVLTTRGRIIVTMGHPLAEILVHQVVWIYDRVLGTKVDMDTERGMHEDEAYYLTDSEIQTRLARAGFIDVTKKYFRTQWLLNHMFIGTKPG
jgi:SAM-dependent methyltransferase